MPVDAELAAHAMLHPRADHPPCVVFGIHFGIQLNRLVAQLGHRRPQAPAAFAGFVFAFEIQRLGQQQHRLQRAAVDDPGGGGDDFARLQKDAELSGKPGRGHRGGGAVRRVAGNELGAVERQLGQHLIHFALVQQKALGFAAADFVKRRLRQIQPLLLQQRAHVAEEKSQQQRADVRAVHIGVRHDHDAAVADFFGVHLRLAGLEAADGRVERGDFLRGQRLGAVGLFHIQNFSAQGQNRLKGAGAPLLRRAAGRVALHQKQLAFGRILFLTIRQFAGQAGRVEDIFAPRHLARPTGGLAGLGGLQDFPANRLGLAGVFLQIDFQRLRHDLLHRRADFGGDQLFLRLRGKLGVGRANGQHAGQALAHVLAGDVGLYFFRHAAVVHLRLDDAGDGRAQAGQMGAAVALGNVVCVADHILLIAVVPLHGGLHLNVVAAVGAVKHFLVHRRAVFVQKRHIRADAAVEGENLLALPRTGGALVAQDDAESLV